MIKPWPLAFFSLSAGIILGYYHAWMAAFFLLSSLLLAGIRCQRYARQIFICFLILLGGLLYADICIKEFPASLPVVQGVKRTGVVQDFPFVDGDKTTFILKTDQASSWEKRIRVVCYYKAAVCRGDRVTVSGVMKPPLRPGNPGAFNYPLYLAHNGIYYGLSVKHPADLQLVQPEQGLLKWIDHFRARGEKITKEILPEQEAAILLGMLLGSREGIDDKQYEDFQKTGIIHLFSVSGLHVGFLLLLVNWITSLIGLSRRNKFISGTLVLLIYGTMVAWPVCVLRAILMGILGLLAFYAGRGNSVLNAMALAGCICLLINPAALFTISFQLTFLATWGVVYVFPRLREKLPVKSRGWDLLLLPLAAELAVLPLIAYYFYIFTPVSLLSNIPVSYLSGAAVILGFGTFILAEFCTFLAPLLLYPAGFFVELIIWTVNGLQTLPAAYIWVAAPPLWSLFLYYSGLLLGLLAINKPVRSFYTKAALGTMLLFFIILLIPAGFYQRGYVELDFIDVGQGDAILLKTPQGRFILIDGGGNSMYDVGKSTLLPYLHRRGIRKLNLVINSHPDTDHLQGIETLLQDMPVDQIALPASLVDKADYNSLHGIASSRQIPVSALQAGQSMQLEKGLLIKVLHPGGQHFIKDNSNNQSVVLQINYHRFSALLTGDIETEAMQALLQEGRISAATIVKVPHHGSKGSLLAAFYQHVQPCYAIISVGSNNLYGHPNPATLAMLKEQKIKTLRTDQVGAIIIRSDGKKVILTPTWIAK